MAGVRMPSPISMHMPNIATKSNILLANMLLSRNFSSLPCFLGFKFDGPLSESFLEFEFLDERMPMLACRQSREYRANVPPAI
jgi:hypothetical protein